MGIRAFLDKIEHHFEKGGKFEKHEDFIPSATSSSGRFPP